MAEKESKESGQIILPSDGLHFPEIRNCLLPGTCLYCIKCSCQHPGNHVYENPD